MDNSYLNLEWTVFAYFAIMYISAATTLISATTRAFSEYGKQLSNRVLDFLFISKKKYFGHMYIFAFLLDCFVLYHIFTFLNAGHKNSFTSFLSTNSKPISANDLPSLRLSYECILHILVSRHRHRMSCIDDYSSNSKSL